MTKEALKLALEALESSRIFVTSREKIKHPEGTDWYDERISAIKEALAQPEQEPAAWRRKRFSPELGEYFEYKRRIFSKETDGEDWTPLYTTPPHCKPLPYEQLDSLWQTTDTGDFELDIREFARAIEAAHGIKE